VIASTRVASPGNPPMKFTIAYDPARIVASNRYVARARIVLDDKLLFTGDTATPVITRGGPTSVSMMLRRVGADQAGSSNPASGRPLERTYWKATELAGKPTPAQDANREAHLMFQAAGRVSGSDGCNRVSGTYQLKGDEVDTGKVERVFREALNGAKRLTITGDGLELFDAAGSRVAVLTAGVQVSAPSASPGLRVPHGNSSSSRGATKRH
jgi:hypothetical protein